MKLTPEAVIDAEDIFTEEELKQIERDVRLDGNDIPNWSIHYKSKDKEDSDD